jgi:hypothetical protein
MRGTLQLGTVLVDGFVAGSWELVGKGESTDLRVRPYVDLDSGVLDAVEVEGNRLLDRAFGVAEPVVTIKP